MLKTQPYLPLSIPQVASSAAPLSDIICSMLVIWGSISGNVRKATRFPQYMVELAVMKNHQKQMRSLPESASGNMFPPGQNTKVLLVVGHEDYKIQSII